MQQQKYQLFILHILLYCRQHYPQPDHRDWGVILVATNASWDLEPAAEMKRVSSHLSKFKPLIAF